MRDLITDPAWQAKDLGTFLPDNPHAVSVCLPTWDSVIGYEEGDKAVTDKMQCGYPRFFRHPSINELFAQAQSELCCSDEACVLFPNRAAAKRAADFLKKRECPQTNIVPFSGVISLIFPKDFFKVAMEFWRYTGEIISSRQAHNILSDTHPTTFSKNALLEALSHSFKCRTDQLFLYENGMSACYAAFRAATSFAPAKKTLQLEFPYVDVLKIQQNFGAGVVYLNEANGEAFSAILERIKAGEFCAVFCELPSNPLLRSVDLKTIAEACQTSETCLIIDDTICSHYNVDVSQYADLITTSMTKWISGKGDVMAGALRIGKNSLLAEKLHKSLIQDNPSRSKIYEFDQLTLLKNLEGFPQRMLSVNHNGLALANLLIEHPAVDQVWYPSITTTEQYNALKTDHGGYGALISFSLKKPESAPDVFDALEITKGPSLGTEFSLACPYTMLAHYDELEWVNSCNVPSNLIRISVGIEPVDSLITKLNKALKAH